MQSLREWTSLHKATLIVVLFAEYTLPIIFASLIVGLENSAPLDILGPLLIGSLFAMMGLTLVSIAFSPRPTSTSTKISTDMSKLDWLYGHSSLVTFSSVDLAMIYFAITLGPLRLPMDQRFNALLITLVVLLFLYLLIFMARIATLLAYGQEYESYGSLASFIGAGALGIAAENLRNLDDKNWRLYMSYSLRMLGKALADRGLTINGIRQLLVALSIERRFPENKIEEGIPVELTRTLAQLPSLEDLSSKIEALWKRIAWIEGIEDAPRGISSRLSTRDWIVIILGISGALASALAAPVGTAVVASPLLQVQIVLLLVLAALLYLSYRTLVAIGQTPLLLMTVHRMRKQFTNPHASTWQDMAEADFIRDAQQRTSVIWWGGAASVNVGGVPIRVPHVPIADVVAMFRVLSVKTRTREIIGFSEWHDFAKTCYTVHYKDGKGWQNADAKNYSLLELAKDKASEASFIREKDNSGKPTEFTDDVIVTVYDSSKGKRVMVDGTHRAVILLNEAQNPHGAFHLRIIECYGADVEQIFPCDFAHL
jgi:DNA-binding transcriptional MerR regulator